MKMIRPGDEVAALETMVGMLRERNIGFGVQDGEVLIERRFAIKATKSFIVLRSFASPMHGALEGISRLELLERLNTINHEFKIPRVKVHSLMDTGVPLLTYDWNILIFEPGISLDHLLSLVANFKNAVDIAQKFLQQMQAER